MAATSQVSSGPHPASVPTHLGSILQFPIEEAGGSLLLLWPPLPWC